MIKIFTDFDGTITLHDVGDAMFERFGGKQCSDIVQEYREGKISASECFKRECDVCGIVNINELNAFLDRQEIDGTFVDFLAFCRSRQLPCFVVSDGMDYYIKRILDRHRVGGVPFFANELRFVPVTGTYEAQFEPHFPYKDETCDRCACCKRNHILMTSSDEDIIIMIGEGYSDRCPARYADVVFAKDDLLTYCQQENISYFEYGSFADVQRRLEKLLGNKRADGSIIGLRKRRRAELARREVFMGE